ncbi:HAMP domain-containing sensor histidine kinase [Zavarzinella formosa]|uniref:HAMP domain-containing sensor histidine kinase n=1 Tax=Zavarzinella formosa TaxID=360055 RepID=UPI000302B74B|nr:HAMP domain-containing sensor histidine kinase [Zavarzinella formosa]
MFTRIFIAFLCFGLLTSSVVGAVLLQRLNGGWFPAIFTEALPIIGIVGLMAVPAAYYFANTFVRPIEEIRFGAERIASGNYQLRVHGGNWRESRELARTFNEMSFRLASQFAELQVERRQLRTILGGMIEGVVAIGEGQRILFANEAAGQMLEFNPDEAMGRPFWEVSRFPAVQKILDQALADHLPRREPIELKGFGSRHLKVYVSPLRDEHTPNAIMVLHDTSDLHRLERLRQDFVANVSHELKTPLAVVKACVETLQDGAVEDPDARVMFLASIAEQADRLHALILDLLSLARIESGAEIMEFEEISLNKMVARCMNRQRPRAEAKRMTLELESSDPESSVWADEEALVQILDNLLDNAVKYTQEGGTVRVRWQQAGPNVCFSVADNGPGIPERDLPRIFERFYRVDKARSRELGGTGLGLSIVKHLTQTMKGTVKATSDLGRGTTFMICLPRSANDLHREHSVSS